MENLKYFEEEIKLVRPDARFNYDISKEFGVWDYLINSYEDRYEIIGGSKKAIEAGFVRMLRDLGFRFYTPQYTVRPKIDSAPRLNKFIRPAWSSRLWPAYGHDKRFRGYHNLEEPLIKFQVLNGLNLSYERVGHAWIHMKGRIEVSDDNPEGLFVGNTLQLDHPDAVRRIVKDRIEYLRQLQAVDPDEYMVSIDASDGDTTPSDVYYEWVNKVAKSIKEQAPESWVSSYAYAGHRHPPSFKLEDNVFIQVAIGFSTAGFPSYDALVNAWNRKASRVGIREYADVLAWGNGHPGRSKLSGHKQYWQSHMGRWRDGGADIFNAETSASWFTNLVGNQIIMNMFVYGQADTVKIRDEIIDNMFEGDEKIKTLYKYMASGQQMNEFMWRRIFVLLRDATVRNQAYLDLRDAMIVQYQIYKLGPENTFGEKISEWEKVMSMLYNVMPRNIVHSYGLHRRLANSRAPRPDLNMFANPIPDWYDNRDPVPTEQMMLSDLKDLFSKTKLPKYSDEYKLVNTGLEQLKTPYIQSRYGMTALIMGPISYYIDDEEFEINDSDFLKIILNKNKTLKIGDGDGTIAVVCSPKNPPWLESVIAGNAWIYHTGGDLLIDGNPRITMFTPDRSDNTPLTRESGKLYSRIPNVGKGLQFVSGPNMRGFISIWSDPPLIQLKKDKIILPADVNYD